GAQRLAVDDDPDRPAARDSDPSPRTTAVDPRPEPRTTATRPTPRGRAAPERSWVLPTASQPSLGSRARRSADSLGHPTCANAAPARPSPGDRRSFRTPRRPHFRTPLASIGARRRSGALLPRAPARISASVRLGAHRRARRGGDLDPDRSAIRAIQTSGRSRADLLGLRDPGKTLRLRPASGAPESDAPPDPPATDRYAGF